MYRFYVKRLIDILGAVCLLPLFFLIIIIIGPIIYFQDKGTIFYNALRIGKNGRIYKMYKFRSMKLNAEDIRNKDGSTFNSENDPRLTKIGLFIRKTSIDEIPQLLNVLIGDMSMIGPRPDLPEHINYYSENERRKLEIRPGITGYSQAYFRNTIPWKDRIQNDIYYIDNLSLVMDFRVALQTLKRVLRNEDVFISK